MPVSWAAWTTHWYIYFWQFLANRASVGQLEAHVRKSFESENTPEVLSEKITSNTNISVKREVLEAGQEWEVFHVSPKSSESRKRVVIYWHGGAFIRRAAPSHWNDAITRMATESKCHVVVPIYTLAPLTTAREWQETAVDLVISLSNDERYTGFDIVSMGDSAGGWMTLRLYQVMCEIALGKDGERKDAVDKALTRIHAGIMISPVINSEINDDLIEASMSDCWLSVNLFRIASQLWTNGPAEFPLIFEALPAKEQERYRNFPKIEIASPVVCLEKNIALFDKYAAQYPDHGPFRFTTFIGTADMCHRPVIRLQKSFEEMDSKAVVSDTTIEEGLYHVYPIIPSPEAEKAWVRIREVLEA